MAWTWKMWIALLLQSERLFKLALTLTLPHETLKSKEKARPFYNIHLDKVKNSSCESAKNFKLILHVIKSNYGHWSLGEVDFGNSTCFTKNSIHIRFIKTSFFSQVKSISHGRNLVIWRLNLINMTNASEI